MSVHLPLLHALSGVPTLAGNTRTFWARNDIITLMTRRMDLLLIAQDRSSASLVDRNTSPPALLGAGEAVEQPIPPVVA